MTRIAILGWGSLIWDPRDLPLQVSWNVGGPKLPIEFSRISRDRRLTLVIDEHNGVAVVTRFAQSARTELNDSIDDLQKREQITGVRNIGFLDLVRGTQNCRVESLAQDISSWTRANDFDAAIWTDLPPNFEDETGIPFSVDAASAYLSNLPKAAADRARTYIQNAPIEVATPLRHRLGELSWL